MTSESNRTEKKSIFTVGNDMTTQNLETDRREEKGLCIGQAP